MGDKEFYYDCEYDIHVYKTKDMKNSRHEISGTHKLALITGVCSFLQSCLDANILTPEELDEVIYAVKEVRKTGMKNKVVFSNLDIKED